MSRETLNLTPAIYDYLLKNSLREPAIFNELRLETGKLTSVAQMQISPEQGQFLGLLIELMNAKKTLDIGTFTGYSALVAAVSMGKEGRVIACDVSEEWTTIAKRFWQQAGVLNKIELRLAPALQTLQKLLDEGEQETFDFAFIDADKANYIFYYEKSLQLIRKGGLIAVDNVLWGGRVADPAINDTSTRAIRSFNQALLLDERVSISLVPIGDGLTLARKR